MQHHTRNTKSGNTKRNCDLLGFCIMLPRVKRAVKLLRGHQFSMHKPIAFAVPTVALIASAWALSAPATINAAPPAAPAAFNQCKACHSIEAGKGGVGPSLAGVVGREAGAQEGYNYSPAMRRSGKVWTEEELNAYLANPMGAVPGTKMALPVRNAAQRRAIIEYLKTL